RTAPMAAEHLGVDPVQLEELKRLRVLPRRDLDLVAALPQELDERPEHEYVRRRGHVDPDAERPRSGRGASRPRQRTGGRGFGGNREVAPVARRATLDQPEARGDDGRVVLDRALEEALVREPPVLDRLEALALVAREPEVDLPRRDHARLRHLDHADDPLARVVEGEAVAWLRRLLLVGEAGR